MFRKKNAEDFPMLAHLEPVRRYNRNEVLSVMALISGIAIDGFPIKSWAIIDENEKYFKVEVLLDEYNNATHDRFENWYFFKA